MMQKHEIRVVNAADIPQIFNIESECFMNDSWSENILNSALQDSRYILLCAWVDDVIAAYLCATHVIDEVSLERIAVLSKYRHRSLAKLLLSSLEYFTDNFASFITLEVRRSNVPAINLYKASGYEVVGLRADYYSNPVEDAILMTKLVK